MTTQAAPRLVSSLKSISQAASVVSILVGFSVLVGWMFDIGTLKSVLHGTELGLTLIVMSNIVIFTALVLWTAGSLNRTGIERKQAEEELRQSQAMFQGLFESAPDAILAVNREGNVILLNDRAEKMFGYRRGEILGKPVEVLMPERFKMRHTEHRTSYMSRPHIRPMGASLELLGKLKDGTEFPIDVSLIPIKRDGDMVALSIIRDITERKQVEAMMQHTAFYDTLTDLPNRNMLYSRLLNAIRTDAAEGKPVAMLLMDLDRFKEINDTLGHHRGDFVLQQVGSRLKSVLFEPDIVARMGGDEFAILLPRLAAAEHINVVIQKILKALEAPFVIEGLPIAVGASIGVALYPDHGVNPDSLIQRADIAMYAAKESGSGYVIYDAKVDQHNPRRLALMGELRQAIDGNQLFLHYQPKIDLKTDRVIGVEALVRWNHPRDGMVPPDQFIGPAEQTGLIHSLTYWVLNTAMRQRQAWHQAEMEITVSVNLSARNLADPKILDQVAQLFEAHRVAPNSLIFEITESAIMADPTQAMEVLTGLSKMGLRFSVDDFGTGYSSLSYLKRLPVEEIKIDKSFILDMLRNGDDTVIVLSIINLVHNLSRKVVAEGVENKEVLGRLSAFGCDAAQGYYMCRPLPAAEFTRWLSESPYGLKEA